MLMVGSTFFSFEFLILLILIFYFIHSYCPRMLITSAAVKSTNTNTIAELWIEIRCEILFLGATICPKGWVAERLQILQCELRSKIMGLNPWPCHQFFNPRLQKIYWAPSVMVIVVCRDHRLLWQDSYTGIDHASRYPKSILHQIIIIIL